MQEVRAILPQSTSPGTEEKPREPPGELDLEADLQTLEKIVKKWEKAADVNQVEGDTLSWRHRHIISSKSFLGESGLTSPKYNSKFRRSRTQVALTKAIISLNNVACTSEQGLVGIASPAVLYVNKKLLLRTSYGDWLIKAGWMGHVTAITAVIGILGFVASRVFADTLVIHESQQKLTIHRRSSWLNLFILLCCLFLWFHVLQCVNRSMFFMLFTYFETIIIAGCQLLGSTTYIYNIYITFGRAGLFDVEWQVWSVLLLIFVHMPGSLFVACMDSLRLEHLWLKTGIVTSGLALHVFSYVRERFFGTCWSTQHLVMFGYQVGNTRLLFCSMEFQICIFLSKMLINYLMGYPWCVMRADYLRPHHVSDVVPDDEELSAAMEKDTAATFDEGVSSKKIRSPPFRGEELHVQTIEGDEPSGRHA